ncbi:glutamate/tyrosine decarboxylase-like PLP-dependent enzyme [Streptomyces umbrinus]|uniref:Glutamate/tyrosine decarboxylase-like PLP-dependent enzyme n=1 Tax=Streptomyces umbrinus TaxID=67370 RepID=A0ABU0T6L5_9ACTN|nr:pyridoxal-dependent decarboxylase [Streptomyces umbrinus]MDQ1031440.1 glutamate/tyrosine decarboxylase-like PLP-dependent enzyme [Streptomyces umbrinus]
MSSSLSPAPPTSDAVLGTPVSGSAGAVMPHTGADPRLRIGHQAHDKVADTRGLLTWIEELRREQPRVLGFPGSLDFSHRELAPLLDVLVNNVGDPSQPDASGVHAKAYEQAVVRFFAETASASDPDDVYGYVTSGGTEGLERGLELARDRLPDAVVYASSEAHYTLCKVTDRLRMKLLTVQTLADGSMDPSHLEMRAIVHRSVRRRLKRRDPGAIVVATAGTTFRGGWDDTALLRRAAGAAGEVYVHVDAALGGPVAAHAPSEPSWSFAHGADSISVSGHKLLGLPVPAGVFLARPEVMPEATVAAEYVAATDRTWGCSRSGLAVLLMWAALRRLGHEGMRARVQSCLDTAAYAAEQLERVGATPERARDSLTVTFDRPADRVVDRWHLACEGRRAHMVAVGHVTRAAVDALVADLSLPLDLRFDTPNRSAKAAVETWIADYVSRPHPQLGRSGAVCPYVVPAQRAGLVHIVSANWTPTSDRAVDELGGVVLAAVDQYEAHAWPEGPEHLRALIVLLDPLTKDQGHLLDAAHAAVKVAVMQRGLMIGQLHPDCDAPAAHSPAFPVNRAPRPLIAVRRMVRSDHHFAESDDQRAAYRMHFPPEQVTP